MLGACTPREECRRDAYATLSLGNMQLQMADGEALEGGDKEKRTVYLDKAAEIFRAVLQAQPSNAYAASGLGAVCVRKGRLKEAQQIYSQATRSTRDPFSPYVAPRFPHMSESNSSFLRETPFPHVSHPVSPTCQK